MEDGPCGGQIKSSKTNGSERLAWPIFRRNRQMKPAGEGTKCNNRCSKNTGRLGICLALPMELQVKKLPTIS